MEPRIRTKSRRNRIKLHRAKRHRRRFYIILEVSPGHWDERARRSRKFNKTIHGPRIVDLTTN